MTPKRRTKAAVMDLKASLKAICEEYGLITIRQLFYQAVSRGLVEKTESQYRRVGDFITDMRNAGELDMDLILDPTRAEKVVSQWVGLAEYIEVIRQSYRINYWHYSPDFIQVWLEKEALTTIVRPVCDDYGVGLWVSKGFASLSYLSQAADQLAAKTANGIPCKIVQFGDHDPSGKNIFEVIEAELIRLTALKGGQPDLINYERVSLTADQVVAWGLPTRPTKASDSRAKNFKGPSTELDALPPDQLSDLVRQAILDRIDISLWNQIQDRQRQDEATINALVSGGVA